MGRRCAFWILPLAIFGSSRTKQALGALAQAEMGAELHQDRRPADDLPGFANMTVVTASPQIRAIARPRSGRRSCPTLGGVFEPAPNQKTQSRSKQLASPEWNQPSVEAASPVRNQVKVQPGRAWAIVASRGDRPLMLQPCAFAGRHQYVVLIIGAVDEGHDPCIRTGP